MTQLSPYQILGDEGIAALAAAFYEAMDELPQAQAVRAMHAENLDMIEAKLAQYLTGWMGGPPLWFEEHGDVCLTKAHAPFHIGPNERDQWLACMDVALQKIGASDELVAMLKGPMYNIAEVVRNQPDSPQ